MEADKKGTVKLGVIGGLGPLATALFYEQIIRMTKADRDQDHLDMIICSYPGIADRTDFITGKSKDNPLPELVSTGLQLAAQGVGLIAVPCITAHYFYKQMQNQIQVPIVNMIEETTAYLQHMKITKIGIMATDGTIQSQIFQKSLAKAGIEAIVPDKKYQSDIMHIIYNNVKAGVPVEEDRFSYASDWLRKQGAQINLLGCTELSIVKDTCKIGHGYLDVLEILAMCCVIRCGALLKDPTFELIT